MTVLDEAALNRKQTMPKGSRHESRKRKDLLPLGRRLDDDDVVVVQCEVQHPPILLLLPLPLSMSTSMPRLGPAIQFLLVPMDKRERPPTPIPKTLLLHGQWEVPGWEGRQPLFCLKYQLQ